MNVRLLGPGDEAVVARLVDEDVDFDLDGRGGGDAPADLVAYLADPAVLHWVAEADGEPVGHLHCTIVRLSYGPGRELLLYEIGVRESWRRQGVGRALMAAMTAWMDAEGVAEVWVLADNPGARDFYAAVGFVADPEQPTYMTRG